MVAQQRPDWPTDEIVAHYLVQAENGDWFAFHKPEHTTEEYGWQVELKRKTVQVACGNLYCPDPEEEKAYEEEHKDRMLHTLYLVCRCFIWQSHRGGNQYHVAPCPQHLAELESDTEVSNWENEGGSSGA